MADRDNAGLPYCESDQINILASEYQQAVREGSPDANEKCFNLTWGLVHARTSRDQLRGVDLADAMLHGENADVRELLYLKAVGLYRLKRYLDARTALKEVLELHPEFRQANTLLEACENQIIKEGLIGVGAGAAILGVIGAIAVAAMRK